MKKRLVCECGYDFTDQPAELEYCPKCTMPLFLVVMCEDLI